MSMDELNSENMSGNAADADPIARNPKDVDNPDDAVQAIQAVRRSETPVHAANFGLFPGQALGGHQSAQPARSMLELVGAVLWFK